MKGAKLLFKCLVTIGCLVLLTINGYAQKATVTENFGRIDGGYGNTTAFSVENGKTLILLSSDKYTINCVVMRLSKTEAKKLVHMFEKALADLTVPVKLKENQTSEREIGGINTNSRIVIGVKKYSTGAWVSVGNYDWEIIRRVPLTLDARETAKYLEALQKAVKSMK